VTATTQPCQQELLASYHDAFCTLTPEEAEYLIRRYQHKHVSIAFPDVPDMSGESAYQMLSSLGIDHAAALLPLKRDRTTTGVACLEKLVGRPLRKPQQRRISKKRSSSVRRIDNRVIATVGDNPKKRGSKSHARFSLYEPGMTVSAFVDAGGTTADVRWDLARGYITLEEK